MPQTQVRVVGSGFTTLNFDGTPIAFLDSFRDSGQAALGGPGGPQGYEAITPLGERHPVEIATTRVLREGTLTATIRELWNVPVWQSLGNASGGRGGILGSARNIVDVWEALAARSSHVTCTMLITPPQGAGARRGKTYHNCVVTAIDDSENVTIGALSVARDISIVYTHSTAT